jgi:hypothetical protein
MGFGAARSTPKPSMLVGFRGAANHAEDARKAGADCLLIEAGDRELEAAKLKELRADAGDLPLGVLPKSGHAVHTKALRESGVDFLAFEADATPAAALLDEEMGYVLVLEDDAEELFLRSLDALTLDGVYLDDVIAPLSVKRQLELSRVGQLSHKTLICKVQPDLSSEDLQCFRAAGVVLLLVDRVDAIAVLKEAVAGLPAKRQRRDERPVVALPRGQAPAEDEDDDDE